MKDITPVGLAGLVFYSPAAPALTALLRDRVGVPLHPHRHGKLREHQEGLFSGVHFAIWEGSDARAVPTFRVPSLDEALARATASGIRALHAPIDLGEGKRVVSLEAGGVEVRFIQIA
jgi:hypothetical protein